MLATFFIQIFLLYSIFILIQILWLLTNPAHHKAAILWVPAMIALPVPTIYAAITGIIHYPFPSFFRALSAEQQNLFRYIFFSYVFPSPILTLLVFRYFVHFPLHFFAQYLER